MAIFNCHINNNNTESEEDWIDEDRDYFERQDYQMRQNNMDPEVRTHSKARPEANRFRAFPVIRVDRDFVSADTGLPMERLSEIQAGAPASLAELRDIAYALETSTRGLTGEHFYAQPVRISEDREPVRYPMGLSGFWGCVTVIVGGNDISCPITEETKDKIISRIRDRCERIPVPTLDNRILLINMKAVESVTLAYESDGVRPIIPVFYEIMEDWLTYDGEIPPERCSPMLLEKLMALMERYNYDEEDMNIDLDSIQVWNRNGRHHYIRSDIPMHQETLSAHVLAAWLNVTCMEGEPVYAYDNDGSIFMPNLSEIAILEIPLLAAENASVKWIKATVVE